MQESFRSIARALGMSDHGDGTTVDKQVLTRISAEGQETLLIYDSMDSTDLIQTIELQHSPKWRSSSPIKVLITTRNRRCLQLEPSVRHAVVDPLQREEAITLLSISLPDAQLDASVDSYSSIASICDDLGCLPLGIQQASSYITVTDTPPQQYLVQLREEPRHTLAYSKEWLDSSRQEKTVWTVWEDSLQRIENKCPMAAKLFCLCSFLGTDVPYSLFQTAYDFYRLPSPDVRHQNPAKSQIQWLFDTSAVHPDGSGPWRISKLHTSVIELNLLSMAKTSLSGEDRTFTIHALVQQWARLRLPLGQQKSFISIAASLIYSCAQTLQRQHKAPADSRATYLHQRHLLNHAYSCIDFCDRVLDVNIGEIIPLACSVQFATFLIHEREYAAAERTLQTSIQVGMRHGSQDAEADIEALRALSLALRRQGKLSEALREQMNALKKLDDLDSTCKLRLVGQQLRAQAELATIYRDLGRLDEALTLQSSVVERTRCHFGGASLEMLHETSCLGVLTKKTGDYQTALQIEEEVLGLYKEHFPDRLEMWDAVRSLAITYYYLDRDSEAIELELQVLAAKTKLYGPDHLETASAMQNLATTYKDVGNYEEAYHHYLKALEIRQAVLGESDEKTRKTARHLDEVSAAIYKHGRKRVDSGISMG